MSEADVNSGEVVTVGPVCFQDGVGTCGACEAAPVACEPTCADGETCEDGVCVAACEPTCAEAGACGDDGCGGSCGVRQEA